MALILQTGQIDVAYYNVGDPIHDDKGNRLNLLESDMAAPTALAARGEPFVIAGTGGQIVGVVLRSAAASTDYIPCATSGVWCLNVVASDDGGTSAVVVGDMIYIHSTTAVLSKDSVTGVAFGRALTPLSASATAAKCAVMVGQ
jgi:hypothetical protein